MTTNATEPVGSRTVGQQTVISAYARRAARRWRETLSVATTVPKCRGYSRYFPDSRVDTALRYSLLRMSESLRSFTARSQLPSSRSMAERREQLPRSPDEIDRRVPDGGKTEFVGEFSCTCFSVVRQKSACGRISGRDFSCHHTRNR